MKKTLTILAFIILGTIVLALCSLFVRYGLDAFTFLGGVALAIITYLTTGVWSVGRIAVFGVLALAIAACVILLIKLIKKKYKNVSYSDFLKDNRFQPNDFFNADHLSEVGAKKFTIILQDTIKKYVFTTSTGN